MARDVKVTFRGDDKVTGVLGGIQARLQGFASSARGILTGIGVGLGAGALGAFFRSAVQEAGEASIQSQQLGQAVRNLGLDFEALAPQLEATIDATRRLSTFSGGDLREALTALITISGDVRGSLGNLTLAADVAAARQLDLRSAAELVGKVMAGNTDILKRHGIEVAAGASAIEVLRQKFGGFAAGEAQTLGGQLKALATQWGEVQEALGRAIAGTDEAGRPVGRLTELLVDLERWIVRNERALGRFASLLSGTVGVAIRVGVVAPINVLTTAMDGLGALSDTLAVGFLQMVQRLQGALGALVRTFGTAIEAAGANELGKRLQATGDTMVLEAARQQARLELALDQALQDRYARANITPGTFNATPQGEGPPPAPSADPADELRLIQERIRGNRESAEDRARLEQFYEATQRALRSQKLAVADRVALEQQLNTILAARQALAERNTGNTVTGRSNTVPGQEGLPNLGDPTQQGGVPGFLRGQRPEGIAAAEGTPLDSLRQAWEDVLDPIRAASEEVGHFDRAAGDLAGGSLLALADGLSTMVTQAFAGFSVESPIKAVRKLVAETAKAEGQLAIRKGVVKIADSIFPFNPALLASGLKLVAAGTALSAAGGFASGGGGGGGGGRSGIAPGVFERNRTDANDSRRGRGVLVISDGVMHTRSPEFRDLITQVVKEAGELGEFEIRVAT